MNFGSAVTAETIETVFGSQESSHRFANFCNAVLVAETGSQNHSWPILSEKPGADGGFDGEWDVPLTATGFSNPFAEPGWNVFQYKARGIAGTGRKKACSDLKASLEGGLENLVQRLQKARTPARYVLFTNLQLGAETSSKTSSGATLTRERQQLKKAIRGNGFATTEVKIVDAAQLAASVNKHPALRLTYFHPDVARPWEAKWKEEQASKNYKVSVPLIGREKELTQVGAWILDPTVKVIAVSGPSGMGKTRLSLEATRGDAPRSTVVEDGDELIKIGVDRLGTSDQTRIVIVEDPTEDTAKRLARQAVASNGVKLLFTFPSEAKTPQLKLTEHESVKQLTLQPLDRERSRQLLKSTASQLDSIAIDWVVQQAGGVPEILLSAAELGPALREKSGDLKKGLAAAYRKRVESELGPDAIAALRLLSALHWVAILGKESDLPRLLVTIGRGIGQSRVVDFVKPLEKMGFLRCRGEHVSVVPPLFAAALSEELFASDLEGMCLLFGILHGNSRKRLLERAITTDLPEHNDFWNHIFEAEFAQNPQIIANLDLLDYLARAIPRRTARFLELRFEALTQLVDTSEHNPDWRNLVDAVRALAYSSESCLEGISLLADLAVREEWQRRPATASQLFCEYFVHWYSAIPLSLQKREKLLRRMLAGSDQRARRLAAQAIVLATRPPHTLSASSQQAQRMGPQPPRTMWIEVYDYIDHFLDVRFELTQDSDPEISTLTRDAFIQVFDDTFLPPDRIVNALEKFVRWHNEAKLKADESEIRGLIEKLERRYREASVRPNQVEHREKWESVTTKLGRLRDCLDNGPFETRLRIGIGREYSTDHEEVNGKRVSAYERRCASLAKEVVAKPELMSEQAWKILNDPKSYNASTFLISLGAADTMGTLLTAFEQRIADNDGSYHYALYLKGTQEHNPGLVDERLDILTGQGEFPKGNLLNPIKITGAIPGNRRRLLKLIKERSVAPTEVASMFVTGSWLGGLPVAEVLSILEFIATGPSGLTKWIIEILSLYLHLNKPLPIELIPLAMDALAKVEDIDDHVEYGCGRIAVGIARTNLDRALELLRSQIAAFRQSDRKEKPFGRPWIPFHRLRSDDFWQVIRELAPERAYRELLALGRYDLQTEIGNLLDVENHLGVLLKIAGEEERNALLFSQLVSGAQPGFFPFAYGIMKLFPEKDYLAGKLEAAARYQVGSFGDGECLQSLARVEAEINNSGTPEVFLPWLQAVKAQIKNAMERHRAAFEKDRYLGWD